MEESKKLEQNLDKSNEKLHISDVISRFIEKLGVKHNIDEKYIMISYDKKDGTLDVWKQTSGSSILLEQILINDL
jgi:transcription initiation factor TFIIIB Brf1 subunit/transcription initiation factor TFIIB